MEETLPRLEFLDVTAPYLYKHITHLTISWDDNIGVAPTWITDMFSRFVNVRSLCLYNSFGRPSLLMEAKVMTLPIPFALGITDLLAKAPIRRLFLPNWNFTEDATDLLLLLSTCSLTLEELLLSKCYVSRQGTMPKTEGPAPPPVVRFEALHKPRLELGSLSIKQLSRIEIPNLDSLVCQYVEDPFRQLSPWIPPELSKLTLKASPSAHRV